MESTQLQLPFVIKKYNRQPNKITMARQNFSLIQRKIYYTLMNQIGDAENLIVNDDGQVDVQFPVKLLEHTNYAKIYDAAKDIQYLTIEFFDTAGNQDVNMILFPTLRASKKGWLRYTINPDFIKLIRTKEGFTQYQYKKVMSLKSIYSQRIYEAVSRWKDTGKWYIRINELRKILSLEKKYSRFAAFEQRILKRAEEEINEKTDLHVSYHLSTHGLSRTPTHVTWFVKLKKTIHVIDNGPQPETESEIVDIDMIDPRSERCITLLKKHFKIFDKKVHKQVVEQCIEQFFILWKEKYYDYMCNDWNGLKNPAGALLVDLGLRDNL